MEEENNSTTNNFLQFSDEELFERYKDLGNKYGVFVEDFQTYLQKFKNIRIELIMIEQELTKRGILKDGTS